MGSPFDRSKRDFLTKTALAGVAGVAAFSSSVFAAPNNKTILGSGGLTYGKTIIVQTVDDSTDAGRKENGKRLFDAWNELCDTSVSPRGGAVILPTARYWIPDTLKCLNHPDTSIALIGQGSARSVWIQPAWTGMKESVIDLTGSSNVMLENVSIEGQLVGTLRAQYGIVMRRKNENDSDIKPDTVYPSAGNHVLRDVFVGSCARASLYSWGSENLLTERVRFFYSPIGAILTAYPVRRDLTDAQFATAGTHILDWRGETLPGGVGASNQLGYGQSNGGGVYIQTHFGNPNTIGSLATSRASVLIANHPACRFVGCMFQSQLDPQSAGKTSPASTVEAKLIIDECWGALFDMPWLDSGGAPIGFKIGKYSPHYTLISSKMQNNILLNGAKVDMPTPINNSFVTIDASNLVCSRIQNVWCNHGLENPIKLDNTCVDNIVENAYRINPPGRMTVQDQGTNNKVSWGAGG